MQRDARNWGIDWHPRPVLVRNVCASIASRAPFPRGLNAQTPCLAAYPRTLLGIAELGMGFALSLINVRLGFRLGLYG
jgi:hypothetical protein